MLTLLAYLRYTERPRPGRYLVTLVTFALGLMTKPMLVTLPFVLLLLDLWPLKRLPWPVREAGGWLATLSSSAGREMLKVFRRLCVEKLPLFVLTLASCIVTFHVQQKGYAVASIEILPIPARLANMLVAYLEYLSKLVWPVNLAVIYPLQASQSLWKLALAIMALGGISAWAVRGIRSRPYVLVGWLWYLGTLVPVIGLVQIGEQAIADRYTYIPMIGLGIIVAWGADSVMNRRPALRWPIQVAGVAALAACVVLTDIQVAYWKDSKTLFAHTLAVTHDNPVALNVFGAQLLAEGKTAEARELFLQSLALRPNGAGPRHCLGTAYAQEGKHDEAIAAFREALRLNPVFQEAHNALGIALLNKQQFDEALQHFHEAARLDPNFLEPLFNRAITYQKLGNLEQAQSSYLQVLKLKPDHRQTLLNLGNLLLAQRKFAEAIPLLQQLLRADPNSVDALSRLAWIRATHEDARLRDGAEAVRLATRACELTNHQNPQSLSSLAAAYAETGRFDEAVQTAQNALALARASGQSGVAAVLQSLLPLFQARTPCRDVLK
jgi:tetratricopeptide (TPR) repeat protein